MKRANITHIAPIINILKDTYSPIMFVGIEAYFSFKIKDHFNNIILLNEDNTMVLFVERLGNFKCQLHIYTLKKVRGRRVKSFFKECIDYLEHNTSYSIFLTFVPHNNPAADLAVRLMGFKRIGEVEDAGGIGVDEVLYSLKKGGN